MIQLFLVIYFYCMKKSEKKMVSSEAKVKCIMKMIYIVMLLFYSFCLIIVCLRIQFLSVRLSLSLLLASDRWRLVAMVTTLLSY